MKKTIAVLFAMASAAVFATAGVDDLVVTFSTPGPDKYADGKVVLDGECYSLAYIKEGEQPQYVLTVQAAKNGKCVPVLFSLSAAKAAEYEGGEWGVFLLDTRDFAKDASGQTLALLDKDGKPTVVNVTAAVADGFAAAGMTDATASTGVKSGSYDLASADVPQPVVTGIKIVGANVEVTVANTRPFVGYTLQSGDDVKNFDVPSGAVYSAGDSTSEIKLVAPKGEGAQFFRVSTIK